jgi:hypothetical protein
MRSVLGICCLFAACSSVFAQTDRGTITGTVSDPAGAVVSNAPLELINSGTGALYQAATSTTGNYTFGQLPVGTYQLTITVPGFKTYIRRNLGVQVAQTIRQDVALEVGTSAESVTVTAEASLLRTESAEVSSNVTSARLNSLPILGIGSQTASSHGVRNPLASSLLSAGVFFLPNNTMRVNGAPSNTMAIRLDGQDATNGVVTFAQAQAQPSVDAIEELSLQTSNYAAEFGQAGAGLFNFTSKSGTNDWHGSVYDYWVNEALWAHQPYNGARNQQRRNDYGGTLGGPVWIPKLYDGRDRSFFFFNYEEFRENTVVRNSLVTVPTPAYRAGNFATVLTGRAISGAAGTDGLGNKLSEGMIFDPNTERLAPNGTRARLQFAGNSIPVGRFDPSSAKIQNLIPLPNTGGPNALINNFTDTYFSKRVTPIPSVKVDHALSDRMKASFYWSTTETAVQYCTPLCGSEGLPDPITTTRGTFIESYTLRSNFDYTLTPTMLLHLGAGFISNDFKDTAPTTDFDMLGQLGIRGGTLGPKNGARFPRIQGTGAGFLGGASTGGMNNMGPSAAQSQSREAKPTGNISLSWVKSNHTFKLGAEIRIEGYPTAGFGNTSGAFTFSGEQTTNTSTQGQALGGAFLGFPYASFFLGGPDNVTLAQPTNTRGARQFWSMFAQDTWKLTRKLTLDYGVRWDYFTYPREQYGRSPAFSPLVANPTAGNHPGATIYEATCNCRFADNYPYAIGPRVGVAYQLDEKTVLRAGFGISYSMTQGGGQGAAGAAQSINNPNFGDAAMILSQGIPFSPVWPDLRPGLFPNPGTRTGSPNVVDANYGRPARMAQWNVGLQREILRDLVVEASYVANRGAWWRNGNLIQPNAITPELLASYGLDWYKSDADRTLLTRQVSSSLAGRFRNRLPYSGFPGATTVAESLRPFPQFGNLGITGAPLGRTWYDSLQLKATKRFSHGLDFTYTYTFSKELQLGAENDGGGGEVNDLFNRATNKQFSSFSRPHWMVFAANYTLPKWGESRWLNLVVSDWTVGAVLQYGSGRPIEVPDNISNNNSSTLLRGTRSVRVAGQPLFLEDLNCHCFDPSKTQVLNPAAWTDAANGTWSPAPAYYNDFRFQRRPQELMSVGRIFRVKERATLMVRVEFNNAFNRTQIPDPGRNRGATRTFAPDGRNLNGYGVINTTSGTLAGQRQGTAVIRLQF